VSEPTTRPVAAFDFDGTLSRRDTLVPFLSSVSGRARFVQVCTQLGLLGARRRVDVRDRDELKMELLRRLFRGRSEAELRERGELYARDLLTNELNPEVLRRVEQHREATHDVVFVSASLVYYLEPLARELGLQGVIAVEPAAEGGVLTGELTHPNVRAEQKAVRLREWLAEAPTGPLEHTELWAYGNSSGDHALLELAHHAYWLGRPSKVPAGSSILVPVARFP
jgi:phosphatidylglycerophosphatase C